MEISVAWLRALVPRLEGTPSELAERISSRAMPVDRVETLGEGLGEIVVARVVEARPHPNADRLTLCRVDAGGKDAVDVVCGAPNVETGAFYPYVAPGASLPGGFRIESRKIRGEMSHGMLCSEKELGLGRDAAGILRLWGDFEPGVPLTEVLDVPDARLEIDLTPNRVDLACHVGVARELAPDGVRGVRLQSFDGPEWDAAWTDGKDRAAAAGVTIRIEDPQRCFRYLGAVIKGVAVGPSPAWLQARLRAAGARPVNNVVDATNYVLLELNQPLHAFDLARLEGAEIRVRAAVPGERLRTLDGADHELTAACTVIADRARPVALAGVMGGEDSEVSDETRDLLIECASFDATHTRRTAGATGLSTDASYRFERGIDEAAMEQAVRRCVELVLAVAGGEADEHGLRVGRAPEPARVVRLRPGRVRSVLGLRLSAGQIAGLLTPLGFDVEVADGEGPKEGAPYLEVTVPGWRGDVRAEVDLLEEIARRYGYDAFPDEGRRFRPSAVPDADDWIRAARVRTHLSGAGLLETRSVPFAGVSRTGGSRVELLHPLSAEESVLRTDLVPVLLDRVERNWSRGRRDIRLFEVGTVFRRRASSEEPPGPAEGPDARDAANPISEERRFGFVVTGTRAPGHWSGEPADVDFWDLRGLVEDVSEFLGLGSVEVGAAGGASAGGTDLPFGTELWLGSESVHVTGTVGIAGVGGAVASAAVDAPRWAAPVFAGEFRLAAVRPVPSAVYRSLPQYPPITRDLAFTVTRDVPAGRLADSIRKAGPAILVRVVPFDVYEGEGIPVGRRSIAWRLTFRAADRTLTDPEVDEAMASVIRALEEELDVRIRAD